MIINTTGKKRDDHLSLVQDWYRNKEQNIQRKKKKAEGKTSGEYFSRLNC